MVAVRPGQATPKAEIGASRSPPFSCHPDNRELRDTLEWVYGRLIAMEVVMSGTQKSAPVWTDHPGGTSAGLFDWFTAEIARLEAMIKRPAPIVTPAPSTLNSVGTVTSTDRPAGVGGAAASGE